MKTLLKSLCCAGLVVGLTGIASAADVQGVLMDKMCSMKAMKEGQQDAHAHTRDCALMPDCQKSCWRDHCRWQVHQPDDERKGRGRPEGFVKRI
jgi:hypothetical protein